MKKKLIYTFIFLVAVIFQTSIFSVITDAKTSPDAVLMMVLAFSILDGFNAFLLWAIFAGIMYDLASYSYPGLHVLIFVPVLYFVSFFSRRFWVELKRVKIILFFVFIAVSTFISHAVIVLESVRENNLFGEYWKAFGNFEFLGLQMLYNSILFFLWFFVLKKVKKFFAIEI